MTSPEPLRVAIVANKTWECEPLVGVLLARDARPAALRDFRRGYDPAEVPLLIDPATGKTPQLPPAANGLPVRGGLPIRPRLSCTVGSGEALVEVWCLEDWMRRQRHTGTTVVDASSSSSHEKFTFALPEIRQRTFAGSPPDLVIAFGTAGIPSLETLNGCVTVGTRVYIHNPWGDAPETEIAEQVARFGPLLGTQLAGFLDRRIDSPRMRESLFSKDLVSDLRYAAEARFLKVPINPAEVPRILAGHGNASLGSVNITDYADYVWADEETLRLFERQVRQREIGSMETTHGLIRLTWLETPFMFVSGLTDRVPMFNAEVTPRVYSQNFTAAHNAAVAVACLLPDLARLHSAGKLLGPPQPA